LLRELGLDAENELAPEAASAAERERPAV
jgi:hypothetical protein